MKKFLNILLKIVLVLGLIFLVLIVMLISANSEKVPNVIATYGTTQISTKTALQGGYKWYAFTDTLEVPSVDPTDYSYDNQNILLVSPSEAITLKNSDRGSQNFNFEVDYFKLFDNDGNITDVTFHYPSSSKLGEAKSISFNAPEKEGTYIYLFKFNYYEKGEVEYSLKAVVSQVPDYNIEELVKAKNTILEDSEKIWEIINLLPYSRNIENINIISDASPKSLTLNYSELVVERKALLNNVIAFFALIPDLEIVEYRDESNLFSFSRYEVEIYTGRDVKEYARDPVLWEREIKLQQSTENNSNDTKYKIITKIIENANFSTSGEKLPMLTMDCDSFINSETLSFSRTDIDKAFNMLKDNFETLYGMKYNNYRAFNKKDPFVGLEKISNPSGDITDFSIYNPTSESQIDDIESSGELVENYIHEGYRLNVITVSNDIIYHHTYYANYVSGDWILEEY